MPASAPPRNRFERRRAETRQALIRAARQILAESPNANVSIQAIAERADVGFGSFYNHFASKSDLFDAAVTDALEEYGQAIDDHLGEIEDPAEIVAASFRLSVRMADSHPEIMQILRYRGLEQIHSDHGLAPRALRDLERGAASGRFTLTDSLVALTAMGGALLGLLELRFAKPELKGDETAERMAETVLRMLGVPADDAGRIARSPLPALG
ncbi:TetR family transcriptional regulator [Streptomyces sp. SID5914]|nr:TetR/AcrR family transcriptional regulator [Streptomyces sp. SID5914]MZG16357.1 TetR family transcriptional regulator [Streptomyces sp. SID5914]